jgi:phosphatidylinositol alpha-mannosyltransferase
VPALPAPERDAAREPKAARGVKVGIVVPFSWSYWGGVVEHAENQARALERLGIEVKLLMGNDPPGKLTKLLHPRDGRHGPLPDSIIPVGRSVIVPANGSLPNIVLTPATIFRLRRAFARERFDVLHLHEPMTPAICVAALALAECPVVATWHAAGELGWMKYGVHFWGFLMDRVDHRIAVSEQARLAASRWLPGEFDVVPNGVDVPATVDTGGRDDTIVFTGRHDPRKGLSVLLRAWPEIHRRTGARLRVIGTDPLQFGLLRSRLGIDGTGIDVLGIVTNEVRTAELARAKAFVSPALGGESFGLVLAEALAQGTPVVASDIPGYRAVMTEDGGLLVPPDDPDVLTEAVVRLLSDEQLRRQYGAAGHRLVRERFSWDDIGRRLERIYQLVTGVRTAPAAVAR